MKVRSCAWLIVLLPSGAVPSVGRLSRRMNYFKLLSQALSALYDCCVSVVGGPAGWLVGGNGKLVMNPLKVCVQASTPINGSGVALPTNQQVRVKILSIISWCRVLFCRIITLNNKLSPSGYNRRQRLYCATHLKLIEFAESIWFRRMMKYSW